MSSSGSCHGNATAGEVSSVRHGILLPHGLTDGREPLTSGFTDAIDLARGQASHRLTVRHQINSYPGTKSIRRRRSLRSSPKKAPTCSKKCRNEYDCLPRQQQFWLITDRWLGSEKLWTRCGALDPVSLRIDGLTAQPWPAMVMAITEND